MPHHFLPDEIIQQKKRASPSKPRPDWAPDLDDFNKDGPRQLAKWRKSHSRPSLEPAGLEKNEQAHILIRQVFGNQKKVARFRAMITGFSDSFGSSWNEEAVFARMDPIPTFQRTSRKIALSFKVVSASKSEGRFNIAQIGRLVNFLYPVWMQPPGGAPPVPQAAPVVEIKFANLISGASKGSNWLSGFIGSLNITHEVEVGFLWDDDGNMIPKEISIGFDFTVLHGEVLGSDPDGKFLVNEFPYGINSNAQKTGVTGGEKKPKKELKGADDPQASPADGPPPSAALRDTGTDGSSAWVSTHPAELDDAGQDAHGRALASERAWNADRERVMKEASREIREFQDAASTREAGSWHEAHSRAGDVT